MSVAYVESSAMVKLVRREVESSTLRDVLRRQDQRVSSELTVVEVMRAAEREAGEQGRTSARAAFLRTVLIPIQRDVIDAASALRPAELRSLDAIHVATALAVETTDLVFISYDLRTLEAAEANGLTVASPGV